MIVHIREVIGTSYLKLSKTCWVENIVNNSELKAKKLLIGKPR